MPPAENSGSFCPRTRLFIRSMAVTPVSMKSCGSSRAVGLIGTPSMRKRLRAATGGPPSAGSPTPLNTRPSRPGPTAKCSGSPRKRTRTSREPEADGRFQHLDHHGILDRARRRGRAWAASPRCGSPPPRSGRPRHCAAGTGAGLRSRSPCLAPRVQAAWDVPFSMPRHSGLDAWRPGRRISRAHPRRSPRPCAASGAARRARRFAAARMPCSSAASASATKRKMSLSMAICRCGEQ